MLMWIRKFLFFFFFSFLEQIGHTISESLNIARTLEGQGTHSLALGDL
jgi:hypothetical protein